MSIALTHPHDSPPPRFLPREHGAYGQLLLPIAVSLILAPSRAGAFLAVAAVSGFLLHEPLRQLCKRGQAVRRTVPSSVLVYSVSLASLVTITTLTGCILAGSRLLPCAGLLLPLLSLSTLLLVLNRERTGYGLTVHGITLPALATPILFAGSASLSQMWFIWSTFAVAHTTMAYGVRAIAATKRRASRFRRIVAPLIVTVLSIVTVVLGWLPIHWLISVSAPLISSILLASVAPHPRHLRKVGWSLVIVSVFTAVNLLVWA